MKYNILHFAANHLINGTNHYSLADCIQLKCDLHLHSNDDKKDKWILYDSYELIDNLESKDFNIFSLTFHNNVLPSDKLEEIRMYAKNKGMLLIPGIEATIKHKHILIYNFDFHDLSKINYVPNLQNLLIDYAKKNKRDELMIVVSHPFFPDRSCLNNVEKHYKYVHGVEYNSFYLKNINFNNKALNFSKEKPFIALFGNSDAHSLNQVGKTFTNLYVRKIALGDDINSIIDFKDLIKNSSHEDLLKIQKNIMYYMKYGARDICTMPLSFGLVIKRFLTDPGYNIFHCKRKLK